MKIEGNMPKRVELRYDTSTAFIVEEEDWKIYLRRRYDFNESYNLGEISGFRFDIAYRQPVQQVVIDYWLLTGHIDRQTTRNLLQAAVNEDAIPPGRIEIRRTWR